MANTSLLSADQNQTGTGRNSELLLQITTFQYRFFLVFGDFLFSFGCEFGFEGFWCIFSFVFCGCFLVVVFWLFWFGLVFYIAHLCDGKQRDLGEQD